MPDLQICTGDLEKLSCELREVSGQVGRYISLPPNLARVRSAMPGGSAAQNAQQAGEHIEEQLSTLRTSFAVLSDNVEASAKQFSVTEDINDIALQAIRASAPMGYLPTGPMRGR